MKSKFNVGDKVHCFRKRHEVDFDFVGVVLNKADTGYDEISQWEYEVTNAPVNPCCSLIPLLIWESEMELAE